MARRSPPLPLGDRTIGINATRQSDGQGMTACPFQNWRADVSAVVTSAGKLVEAVTAQPPFRPGPGHA